MQIPNILGDVDTMLSPGTAAFTMGGQRMQMVAIADPDRPKELWFVFRDLTTGKETDPAARFLYTPLPENGKVPMDFKIRAQNPPCAVQRVRPCARCRHRRTGWRFASRRASGLTKRGREPPPSRQSAVQAVGRSRSYETPDDGRARGGD